MTEVCLLSVLDIGVDGKSEYVLRDLDYTFGEGERERIERMSNGSARELSLCGLCALKCLTDALVGAGERILIARDEFGKPYFPECENLRFNISHSAQLATAALSFDGSNSVGIDIEKIADGRDIKKITQRFFGERERAFLEAEEYSAKAFFLVWTAKEAYAKFVGRGLSAALSGADTFELSESREVQFVRFAVRYAGNDYIMTLCTSHDEHIKINSNGDIEVYEISDRA
ncbi:MAG: 4'-phosphopantetheinyl transferase superfamily protein [Clostridia bacterium]|nr:4'-phosphopantetheinyl transferase superfamily protein [Clostridia bacterium]